MIGPGDVTRLLGVRAPGPGVVSVYLTVPLDPAQWRGLAARVAEVIEQGDHFTGDSEASARARQAETPAIRREVGVHAHEWLGHSVAIFACQELGLLETLPLRAQVRERAVIGTRPYVRPLLTELQRCPGYVVAVVERRHSWLFRVSADGVADPVGHVQGETVGSRRFGGWYGLETYRNDQRTRKLAREHYAATVSALADSSAEGGCWPIVVGGHEAETRGFLGELPPSLRGRVAGTFVVDPHTMTPARVRQLADDVVAQWQAGQEYRLAADLADSSPGGLAAIGLDACVRAANEHAIQTLMVPGEEVRPGMRCAECGTLTLAAGPCPVCGGRTLPVLDIIEELAVKVTQDGGSVRTVQDGALLHDVAARRRFPPPG